MSEPYADSDIITCTVVLRSMPTWAEGGSNAGCTEYVNGEYKDEPSELIQSRLKVSSSAYRWYLFLRQ